MAIQNDEDYESNVCYTNWRKLLADDEMRDNFLLGRAGIAFNSANYDTYIMCCRAEKNEYELQIATCNNTAWDIIAHMKESHEEGSDDYQTIQGNAHEPCRIFYWISDDNKLRSAEHYLDESSLIGLLCKECHKKEASYLSQRMWFDDKLVARCVVCDIPLNETETARKKRTKPKTHPDNILGGIF
jgi:hypothetical protein